MSKKSRRRKSTGPRLSAAQLVRPDERAQASAVVAVPLSDTRSPAQQKAWADLREEYPYVVADLRRIGIIALVMLALLIVLALLLV